MHFFKRENKLTDLIKDYHEVFASEAGKRVLYDLLKKGHILHANYNGNTNDMLFRDGERNIVLYIMTQINTDPQKLTELIKRGQSYEEKYE